MSIRSARSARSGVGAGSVKSHRSITTGSFRVKKMGDDHEKLHDKNDAEEDENISPEENNKINVDIPVMYQRNVYREWINHALYKQ